MYVPHLNAQKRAILARMQKEPGRTFGRKEFNGDKSLARDLRELGSAPYNYITIRTKPGTLNTLLYGLTLEGLRVRP